MSQEEIKAKEIWKLCEQKYTIATLVIHKIILPTIGSEGDIVFWQNVSKELDKLYLGEK